MGLVSAGKPLLLKQHDPGDCIAQFYPPSKALKVRLKLPGSLRTSALQKSDILFPAIRMQRETKLLTSFEGLLVPNRIVTAMISKVWGRGMKIS